MLAVKPTTSTVTPPPMAKSTAVRSAFSVNKNFKMSATVVHSFLFSQGFVNFQCFTLGSCPKYLSKNHSTELSTTAKYCFSGSSVLAGISPPSKIISDFSDRQVEMIIFIKQASENFYAEGRWPKAHQSGDSA